MIVLDEPRAKGRHLFLRFARDPVMFRSLTSLAESATPAFYFFS
jgi:hypothetical protein